MWQLALLVGHLSYIVQKTGTLCLFGVESQFRCHHSAKIRRLACMLQKVLPV